MLPIPRRHAHFLFGVIQSGLTSSIASAIANLPNLSSGSFTRGWLLSWLAAWLLMLPVVLFAAPFIRNIAHALTREDSPIEGK